MEKESTLDPKDWEASRKLAHQVVDELYDYQQTLRDRPVWQPIPASVIDTFNEGVPRMAVGEDRAYQEFKDNILYHPMGNLHPRFWGWVMGNGIPFAALADYMAAVMNPNMGGGEHVANYVERQVINWCKEMVGFPADSSGVLVSGGSMANLIGLTVARNQMAGIDVRQEGLQGITQKMTVYSSTETHSSNYKAVELLGIGKEWLRFIPVNDCYQVDIPALEKKIAEDRAAGYRPICIIGNAATTNTGAFDDLESLANICERESMWFHVDGAFGALAALTDTSKQLVRGMERADSLAFDLHKFMYMPFEVACVLIRNFDDHIGAFSASPDYLSHMPRGLAGGHQAWFGDLGPQLTRGFRALKVWMALKAYGLDSFTRQIQKNIDQARYLAEKISSTAHLELLADAPFNVVCFRFNNCLYTDQGLNELNQEILLRLHERGLAVPSYTRLQGRFAIRVCITNHRTTSEDLDFLVRQVLEIAREIH
jgi:glutamate/tyrosine decarboxylase-like PLP-dependent enzyme